MAFFTSGHTTSGGGSSPYSASFSGAQGVTATNLPLDGFKTVGKINTRAYTKYVNIKTNLTGNNIMFLAHFLGYQYGYANKEGLCGGYTYNSSGTLTILSKANTSVHTGSGGFTVDSYRASDGALCFNLHINHTGYTEGYSIMRFHSHVDSTTTQCAIAASHIRNDGTDHFA